MTMPSSFIAYFKAARDYAAQYLNPLIDAQINEIRKEEERRARKSLLGDEPIEGDVMDYNIEKFIGRGQGDTICCAHNSAIPNVPPSGPTFLDEATYHVIHMRPSQWPGFLYGICHVRKVIFVVTVPPVIYDGTVPEAERRFLVIPEWMRTELGLPPPTCTVSLGGGSGDNPSPPPISAPTCSTCKTPNLEVFRRAEGRTFCLPCVDKLPACTFCGEKVLGDWYKSKRRDAIACPPCMETRKALKQAKEVQ